MYTVCRLQYQLLGYTRRKLRLKEGMAKCLPVKSDLERDFAAAIYLAEAPSSLRFLSCLCFCLCSSNFVGSDSSQKQSVEVLSILHRVHCIENPIYVFPEKELLGFVSSFYIHVSVSDAYIPTIGPPILLYCVRQSSMIYFQVELREFLCEGEGRLRL
jgi:hypothetical protein